MPSPRHVGLELAVDGLAKGLTNRGHEVVLFTIVDPMMTRQWATQIGLAARTIHHIAGSDAELGDCHIVHDHTLAALFVRNLHHRAAVVTTNHGPFDADPIPLYRRRPDDHVPMIALSCDHAVRAPESVTVSTIIHPGIDIDMYRLRPRGSDYFVTTGPMRPDGGIVEAIRVAQAADTPLVIYSRVEDSAEHDYFHDHVRPSLGANVQFLAELTLRDRIDLLGGARALLHTAQRCEPFPLAIVEAMACGTPTIAFADTAAEEIFEHGKTGFVGRTMAELVGAAGRIDAIDRRRCRRRAERYFNADEVARHHEDFYKEVIEDQAAERSCGRGVGLSATPPSLSDAVDCGHSEVRVFDGNGRKAPDDSLGWPTPHL